MLGVVKHLFDLFGPTMTLALTGLFAGLPAFVLLATLRWLVRIGRGGGRDG